MEVQQKGMKVIAARDLKGPSKEPCVVPSAPRDVHWQYYPSKETAHIGTDLKKIFMWNLLQLAEGR